MIFIIYVIELVFIFKKFNIAIYIFLNYFNFTIAAYNIYKNNSD